MTITTADGRSISFVQAAHEAGWTMGHDGRWFRRTPFGAETADSAFEAVMRDAGQPKVRTP